ncbi:PHD finger protein 7-like isoform X2 [Gallus gallus]|uniref:PHD finger protein 7-like isoform X2 n=2 Tax=Gallus gallus TaxID=9031 RepID=UPI001AE7970C|nr:PHD finger protein 7-like isoform X2 [Gallus gallus]
MSMGTKKPASSWEPGEKCVLCVQGDADPDIYGRKVIINGIYFHEFCMIFSGGLLQAARTQGGNESLSMPDTIFAIKQAEQTHCFVCGKRGAFITCAETGCDRSFHLPCASEGECVTQYFEQYRSFCWEHRPQQTVEAVPEQDTTCIICMDPVGDSRSYSTMVCPSCRHAWFHRACIQRLALRAGLTLHCPHCKDENEFFDDMNTMGIHIPLRGPVWDNSYAQKADKLKCCNASECCYPHGRERAGEGPWELLLCSSCAAQSTHRRCSNLSQSRSTWECNTCAGEGTSSSSHVNSSGPSTTVQLELGPSQGRVVSESSSGSSTTRQAPSEPAHSSKVPESSVLTSQRRTEWRRICSRLHRNDDAWNEPQGHCGSSRAAALSAKSSASNSASQGTSRSPRHSPSVGCSRRCRQGRRAHTRSRSPLRRRAPRSPSRPQRRRGSRHAPAPSAESCTHTYTLRGAPQSSRDSTGADGSRSRQPEWARTRSRSPLKHRAAESQSQPRKHRGLRPGRRGPAQERSHSRIPRRAQNTNRRPH